MEARKVYTAAVLAAAAIAAAWLTYRTVFHRGTTALSHEAFVTANTAARIVFCPGHVQGYVSRLAPEVLRIVPAVPRLSSVAPRSKRLDWLHYLPVEFTFLVSQDAAGQLDFVLFSRENPEGPDFLDVINDSDFFAATYPVQWAQPRAAREGNDALRAAGVVYLPDAVAERSMQLWPDYRSARVDAASGAHFLEIVTDNRNGILYELHGAIAAMRGDAGVTALEPLLEVWPAVASLQFTADLAGDNAIGMSAVLVCQPGSGASGLSRISERLMAAGDAIAGVLRSDPGLDFVHEVQTSGQRIEAHMTLSGFEPMLRAALSRGI